MLKEKTGNKSYCSGRRLTDGHARSGGGSGQRRDGVTGVAASYCCRSERVKSERKNRDRSHRRLCRRLLAAEDCGRLCERVSVERWRLCERVRVERWSESSEGNCGGVLGFDEYIDGGYLYLLLIIKYINK